MKKNLVKEYFNLLENKKIIYKENRNFSRCLHIHQFSLGNFRGKIKKRRKLKVSVEFLNLIIG